MNEIKQPPGLYVLFFAELWERFGFYAVSTLLVLYLSKVFLLADTQAYDLFSAYSALIYATPVLGGYIADKFIGFRHGIVLGGCLFVIGYFGLTFVHAQDELFYLSLSLLICGNGFFKSNVSSLLGSLYHKHDIRRDSGFTLFYMGINLGTFGATTVVTIIAAKFGWHYGFGLAAIGMTLGMLTFFFGHKLLQGKGGAPEPELLRKKIFFVFNINQLIYIGTVLAIILCSVLIHHTQVTRWGLVLFSVGTLGYILARARGYERFERNRLIALLILIAFSVVFWSLYFQAFMSITLFIDRVVDHNFFGWEMPTATFQSFTPFFIITLSPFLSLIWLKLAGTKANPETPTKFAFGIGFLSTGFFVLALSCYIGSSQGLIVAWWIVLFFFLLTIGELFLSPVGMSAVTRLSPPDLVGMMMGTWFLSLATANAIAGKVANFTSIPDNLSDMSVITIHYGKVFASLGAAGMGFVVLLVLLKPFLKSMIKRDEYLATK